MGAGGQMSVFSDGRKSKSDILRRVPCEKPPFTLAELRKAVPPHCFQRSVIRSLSYLIYDMIIVFLLYYAATNYIHVLPHPLSYIAWPLYWICQGSVLNGLWVLGHESGHNALSEYKWLDDTIGLFVHSALLVPYFSFKYSHGRHHSGTGSLQRDEVFVPQVKSNVPGFIKYFNNPLGRVVILILLFGSGLPLYLICNVLGRPYDRFASHFDPYSPIFKDRERIQVYISDAAILTVIYGLYRLVAAKGFAWVFCVYGAPLLLVNAYVVSITYLSHTHPSLPRYDSSEWDWLRGALTTVDRDYGSILNKVFHDAPNTHVVHHLFSTLPHYHAVEATKSVKPILGDYYRFDDTPVLKAMWREIKECVYVEPDEREKKKGVFWFNNKI